MKLHELLSIIEKISIRKKTSRPLLCGGVPRDKVLERLNKIEDLDITTGDSTIQNLAKETSIILNRKFNITTKIMDDGHSSIFLGNFKVDFSSNFNVPNIEQYLGKLGIKKPTDMQKEIFSRDFTCNALLMTLDLKNIIDPTKRGLDDMKNKVIRTCLNPEITLTSNKNRVVRAIYLAAKLNFDLDPALMDWIKKNPESIRLASDKALAEKLNKAILSDPHRTTYLLDQLGLWNQIPITKELYPYYMKRITSK